MCRRLEVESVFFEHSFSFLKVNELVHFIARATWYSRQRSFKLGLFSHLDPFTESDRGACRPGITTVMNLRLHGFRATQRVTNRGAKVLGAECFGTTFAAKRLCDQ